MATYYVDQTTGDDADTGLTEALAWKTIAKVNGVSPAAGDSILFKRGETWTGEVLTPPSSGSAGNLITIGKYGTTGADPIIDWTPAVPGWNTPTGAGGNFGYETPGGSHYSWSHVEACKFTSPAGISAITEIRAYSCAASGTITLGAAIYTDNAGQPGTKVASGSLASVDTTPGWRTVPVTGAISASTTYWLAIWGSASFTYYYTVGDANQSAYESGGEATWSTWPTPWTSTAREAVKMSIYAVCTAVGAWTDGGGNVWHMTHTRNLLPSQLILDGTMYYEAANAAGVDSTLRWYWAANVLYVYATSDPATFYATIKVPTLDYWDGPCVLTKNYVEITGIEFRGGFNGIYMNGATYCKIHANTIGVRSQYGIVLYGTTTHNEIYSNTIDSDLHNTGKAYDYDNGDGVLFQNGGTHSYNLVYSNTIADWAHSSVGMTGGCTYNEFYLNTCTGTNANNPRGFNINGHAAYQCSHNKIYRNSFVDMAMSNELFGTYNEVYYNLISTVRNDKYASWSVAGVVMVSGSTQENVENNKLYNNVFYNCYSYCVYLYASSSNGGLTLQNNEIINNILCNWDTGSTGSYLALEIEQSTSGMGYNTYKNNCFYKSGATNIATYLGTAKTLAQFNAITGDTVSGNIQGDPLFVDPANHNFHLQTGSPCRDAGIDVGLTTDFEGNPIN